MGLIGLLVTGAKIVAKTVVASAATQVATEVVTDKMRHAVGADKDKSLQENAEDTNTAKEE